MGKTNCLDAVFTLCVGKSHFNLSDAQLIENGKEFSRMEAVFEKEVKNFKLVMKLQQGVKKSISLDDKVYPKISDHIGTFPVVMVSPDDKEIVTGTPEGRRKFLDTTLCQISRKYLENLSAYGKILKQRNAYLKLGKNGSNISSQLLDTYDEQLSVFGYEIYEMRKEYIDKFTQEFTAQYDAISAKKEKIQILYNSHLNDGNLVSLLKESRRKDMILVRTSYGIHKDDLEISLDGMDARKFASQGQVKSILFSLKFTEYSILAESINTLPLLLLDDIFDKLDEKRVKNLMQLLKNGNFGQIMITDTSINRLQEFLTDFEAEFAHFEVENGNVKTIIS